MAFGILTKMRGGSPSLSVEKPTKEESLDETECTMEDSFQLHDNADTYEDDDTHPHTNDATSGGGSESIESALVEMQHDLREKTAQCDILRETLSTMSVKMKRHECMLQEKIVALELQIELLEKKTGECATWKSKFETLVSEREHEFTTGTTLSIPTLSLLPRMDPLLEEYQQSTDPLLGESWALMDPLLGDINLFPSTDRRPWSKSMRSPASSSSSSNSNDKKSSNGDDEHSTMDLSRSGDDSVESELDVVHSPKRSPRRKPKVCRAVFKEFQTLPMAWLDKEEDNDAPTATLTVLMAAEAEVPWTPAKEDLVAPAGIGAVDEAAPPTEQDEEEPVVGAEQAEKEPTMGEDVPPTRDEASPVVAPSPADVVASAMDRFVTLEAFMLYHGNSDGSADDSRAVNTIVVKEEESDAISVVSGCSVEESDSVTAVVLTLPGGTACDLDAVTTAMEQQRRRRIFRMARRSSVKAQFTIESVEC